MLLQRILSAVIYGIFDYLLVFATIVFLHCFYDRNFLWQKKKALILLGLSFISATLTFFFGLESKLVFIPAIGYCIAVVYDYSGSKIKGILKFLWIYILITIFASLVSVAIFACAKPELLASDDPSIVSEPSLIFDISSYTIVATLLGIVLLYLYPKIYKKGIVMKAGIRERIFAITFPLFVLIFTFAVVADSFIHNLIYYICGVAFGLLVILIPVFVFYSRINDYYRNRSVFQETFMQAELNHFQHYRQAQEETIRFRHDIKNNLLCMNEFLAQGKTDEAKNYLKDLLNIVDTLSTKYVTGDEILDCIVAAKVDTMADAKIQFHLDGVLAGGLPWKPVDVCAVFANAIDNAIEACQRLPEIDRYINMNIKATTQYWFIRIENPTAEKVDTRQLFQKKGGYTSKADHNHHGIGTYNMKHTVETYGGILKAENTNNTFTLEVIIDKSSS